MRCRHVVADLLKATLCATLVVAAGCNGGGLSLATVEGTVTYKGKPVTRGTVTFLPESKSATHIGIGSIRADGSFRIQTTNRGGAIPGRYTVMVQSRREPTPEESRNLVTPESLIPEKYGRVDATPLHFEVKDGSNQMPIILE